MMRIKTFLTVTLLSFTVSAQAADDLEALKQRFIGDYELVSMVRFPESGGEESSPYTGRISYDAFGNMSAIGMPADLPEQNAGSTERIRGGFAYWGKVSFNIAEQRVIHHVEGSPMAPDWVGGDNVRYYQHDGDVLKLSLKDPNGRVTATLTWRKLQ